MKRGILFVMIGMAVGMQFFTNCGPLAPVGFSSDDMASLSPDSPLPQDHPQKETFAPEDKNYLAPRSYVAAVLRSVFYSASYSQAELESHLQTWIIGKPGAFGGNCNPYSSDSGRDCDGDVTNSSLAVQVEGSTVRSSYKIKACEAILSNDAAVQAVIEKLEKPGSVPAESTIAQIYSLFRPGWDADAGAVYSLVEMDHKLAVARAAAVDRWRMVILMICEDPVWEGL